MSIDARNALIAWIAALALAGFACFLIADNHYLSAILSMELAIVAAVVAGYCKRTGAGG